MESGVGEKKEKRVYLVGTVHISTGSAKKVADIIERTNPDLVCMELDTQRYHGMMQELREGGRFRYSPQMRDFLSLHGLLRWLQQRIGEEFGVMPGVEMVAANDAARKANINIALIDRRADLTIQRLWAQLPMGERVRLVSYMMVATGLMALKPVLGKRAYSIMEMFGEKKEVDIKGLENGVGVVELMEVLKDQFPTIYRVLVEERNEFMCRNIGHLLNKVDTLVVVVGAGHVPGMKKILDSIGIPVELG